MNTISNNTGHNHRQDISQCRSLLQKISRNWHRRAQVKKEEPSINPILDDDTKPDFRTDLLPFKNHPDFLQAPEEVQNQILSCGWLAYNEKTIDIEAKVIAPACYHIIYKDIPGIEDEISQQIASQTLVDEAYHVLLVNHACSITRKGRGLQSLKLPDFNLVTNMHNELLNCSETWQKIIVQLVTAIVSEVFISDYLNVLADDPTIKSFNRLTVYTHRCDELAHGSIFKNLAKYIYSQLNREQKDFFIDMLPKPVRWFANMELIVWKAMLEQIGFPHTERVIADCVAMNEINLMRIDYTGIMALATEVGIFDCERGIESFGREGLLN